MITLCYQFDWIWNDPWNTPLHVSTRAFPKRFNGGGSTQPENRPYHPLDSDPRLNQNGQRRNLLVSNVPASCLQRQCGKRLRDPVTVPSCSIGCKLKPWGKMNASSLNEALVTASGKVIDGAFCAKLLALGDLIGKFRESPYHSACT